MGKLIVIDIHNNSWDLNIQIMPPQNITARLILLLLLLDCLTIQQTVNPQTSQQGSVGKWLSADESKEKGFPRYLICGAEMNYFRRNPNTSCQTSAKPVKLPVSTSCVINRPLWERCNGIKFKYCNFEDWNDQKSNIFYGSWEYTGMAMCKQDYYVFDYMTRINDRDGLNGLYLSCRHKLTNDIMSVTVREGSGDLIGPEFKAPVPKQYAYDFMLKFQNQADGGSYITGLNLAFTPFPEITDISIVYDSLPPVEIRPEYFLTPIIRFDNLNKLDRIETVDPNRFMNQLKQQRWKRFNINQRLFTFTFGNSKAKYHSYPIRRHFKESFKQFKLLSPILATRLDEQEINELDRKIIFRNVTMNPDFQFGKVFIHQFPTYPLNNYTIPNCFRLEIRATIYTAVINNPYTLSITYSSGSLSYVQQIRGVHQGTLFGRPEIQEDTTWIC